METCHNCGRDLLPGDTDCWHCGWHPVGNGDQVGRGKIPGNQPDTQPRLQFKPFASYAGLTLALAVAALLLMSSLAQEPLADFVLERTPPPGWTTVIGQTTDFSLLLPPEWRWLEGAGSGRNTLDELLARRPEATQVIMPLLGALSDLQIVLFASGSAPNGRAPVTGFLIIAHAPPPAMLTAEEALQLMRSSDSGVRVLRATLFKDLRSTARGAFLVELGGSEQRMECREEFVSESSGAFLVAACAQSSLFSEFASSYQAMVRSFRVSPDG